MKYHQTLVVELQQRRLYTSIFGGGTDLQQQSSVSGTGRLELNDENYAPQKRRRGSTSEQQR